MKYSSAASFGSRTGWANGWPLGLTLHVIWSAGIASLVFLMLLTLAIGLGALVGLVCSWCGIGLRSGRLSFVAWIAVTAVLALIASLYVYKEAHTSALEMWPNGYPNKTAE